MKLKESIKKRTNRRIAVLADLLEFMKTSRTKEELEQAFVKVDS
jgi:hypothetical protein